MIINNPGQNDDNTVLENFQGLNFDEDSVNYLPRKIGDRYVSIDSNGKLTNNGDYPNQSKYVYVSNFGNLTGISKDLVPMGFASISSTTRLVNNKSINEWFNSRCIIPNSFV